MCITNQPKIRVKRQEFGLVWRYFNNTLIFYLAVSLSFLVLFFALICNNTLWPPSLSLYKFLSFSLDWWCAPSSWHVFFFIRKKKVFENPSSISNPLTSPDTPLLSLPLLFIPFLLSIFSTCMGTWNFRIIWTGSSCHGFAFCWRLLAFDLWCMRYVHWDLKGLEFVWSRNWVLTNTHSH